MAAIIAAMVRGFGSATMKRTLQRLFGGQHFVDRLDQIVEAEQGVLGR